MEYLEDQADARGRAILMRVYQSAVAGVEGRGRVLRELQVRPLRGRVWTVAVGKAAESMLEGASAALGTRQERALLITKHGHARPLGIAGVEVFEAGHPVPDAGSLAAGHAVLDFLSQAPSDVQWLFLISGGASSLVEVLPEGRCLEDLQRLNDWLLASGLPIDQMNRIRQRVSRIKGGGLLRYLAGRPARVLLISDVPGDDPAFIGSGLLQPRKPEPGLPPVPTWIEAMLEPPVVVAPADAGRVHVRVVANLDDALAAAAACAVGEGQPVYRHSGRLEGEAEAVGRRLAAELCDAAPGVHIWGGETTVTLPAQPGVGGRCQQLALAAAGVLAGRADILLLAAGTDGSDGPGEAAGACVDGGTLRRGEDAGLDYGAALAAADAGRFLAAAGDLVESGPTGTNVADIVAALKLNPEAT